MVKPHYKALVGAFVYFAIFSAWGNPQGQVSLSQTSFISPDYHSTSRRDFQLISAGFDTLSGGPSQEESENSLHGQVRGMVAPGQGVLNYLDVTQLYWKQGVVSVGRKKIPWNNLDERFRLGVYEPLFQWNPLQWESQGLTGIFLHLETESSAVKWGATFMGSPLFIPNQGPGYELKDGVFEKTNPYFRNLPTHTSVNGRASEIRYHLEKPTAQDVVFRQSLAARLFVGDSEKGVFGQVAFSSKPMNDLSMGAQIFQTSDDFVNVEIVPAVATHQVLSADIQYAQKHFKFGVSGVQDSPKEPSFSPEWNYGVFKRSTLISPFIEMNAFKLNLQLAALNVQGAEAEINGPDKEQAGDLVPQRYPFRSAQLFGVRYLHRLKRHQKMIFSSRYLRGESGEFDLWTSQISLQWASSWTASLISQLVAVENTAKGRATFYNSFLNNDVISVGVSYVF